MERRPVGTCFAVTALANKGRETWAIQEWLGASINHADGGLHGNGPNRFRDLWRE